MTLVPTLPASLTARLLYVAAGLLALMLLIATSTWYRIEDWGNAPDFIAVLGWQVLTWAPWLGLALVVDRVGARNDLAGGEARNLAVHLAAALAIAGLHTGWFAAVSDLLSPLRGMPGTKYGVFPFFFLFWFQLNLVLYGAIAGLGMSHRYQQRMREREQQAADLRLRWTEAQLQALRLQIRPHFLFNTLNTIVVMQRKGETAAALEMTEALAEMLRALLKGDARDKSTLAEERRLVERYLSIEQHRYGDRLRVTWSVPEALDRVQLPSLVLQTLVENAVRIGAGGQDGPCEISIRAEREDADLVLEVCNPPGDDSEGLGIGLANTRARLKALYGDEHTLDLVSRGARTCVVLRIPREEASR